MLYVPASKMPPSFGIEYGRGRDLARGAEKNIACRPLIADMLLMGGAIRQHCASCHVTAISNGYSTRKMSSFFRMSYCINALIFGNISSASDSVDSVLIII